MPDALSLERLGWDSFFEEPFLAFRDKGFDPGRVAVEDKHYYVVLTAVGDLTAQVAGRLLHQARGATELPKVGDWVVVSKLPNEAKAVIHHVLPRKTKLSRKVAGRDVQEQVLATNIDLVFVVQAMDSSFNPALLQRHLVMVFESSAKPVVVLNKADLAAEPEQITKRAVQVAGGAAVVVASAKTGQGIEELGRLINPGQTVAFIGSSGVGKSSLINDLYGEEIQATAEVRQSDAKGRHVTTWRELIVLPNGGLVIDTPGMREFQMWMANEGLREAFADLDAMATQCHFRNCTHTVEKRCTVLEALAQGQLSHERYQRYLKLSKELAFLEEARSKHSWLQRRGRPRAGYRGSKRAPDEFTRD